MTLAIEGPANTVAFPIGRLDDVGRPRLVKVEVVFPMRVLKMPAKVSDCDEKP